MNEPQTADQQFLLKLKAVVEANLSKEEFSVEELARETRLSRSSIHRKLRTHGVRNASRFIREIRLRKALEMLGDDQRTASEVAYSVGFGSPAYFSKCFHEYFGYTPGEVKRMINAEEAGGNSIPDIFRWARNQLVTLRSLLRKIMITLGLVFQFLPTRDSEV
jgi:transcriptional regulator GlxA family with amidase domain